MESQRVLLVLFIHCILLKHYGKQQGVGSATSAHKQTFYTRRSQDALQRGDRETISRQSPKSLIFYWLDLNLLSKVAIKIQLNWLKASY